MKMRKTLTCLLLLVCSSASWGADVPVPVATDSRIKTFVYSENDVFNLVTHYGYQSNIEFGIGESIETISLGERSSWQIVPAGRRLFVRALTTNAHTNMTVITTKHAYQFDLTSVPMPVAPNEELAYVVRFFYPGDKKNAVPAVYTDDVRAGGGNTAPAMEAPVQSAGYNYSYTFTGSDTLTPVKLYDDGNSTYFKFRDASVSPAISAVGADGKETTLSSHRLGDYWVVDTVTSRFAVRQGNATVYVYNEKLSHS
jgi:type IV secretion system protein VirB9